MQAIAINFELYIDKSKASKTPPFETPPPKTPPQKAAYAT
jgi:hypothetical protein